MKKITFAMAIVLIVLLGVSGTAFAKHHHRHHKKNNESAAQPGEQNKTVSGPTNQAGSSGKTA